MSDSPDPGSPVEQMRNARTAMAIVIAGVVLAALALIALIQVWSECEAAGPEDEVDLNILWFIDLTVSGGTAVLILVAIGGVLGATLTGIRNAASFQGQRTFDRSWTSWYIIRPVLGAGIALVLYLALMGGLLGVNADDSEVNKFGVTALAVLSGLFSRDAIEKLAELFSNIFSTSERQREVGAMAAELEELSRLHKAEVLSDEEFTAAKARLLADAPPAPEPTEE